MLPSRDLVESLLGSLLAAESGFRRAAKDLQSHWLLQPENERRRGKELRFLGDRSRSRRSLDEEEGFGKERRRRRRHGVVADEKERNAVFVALPVGDEVGSSGRRKASEDSCSDCLRFAAVWSILFDAFVQAFTSPKSVRKCFQKQRARKYRDLVPESRIEDKDLNLDANVEVRLGDDDRKGKTLSLDVLLCCAIDNLAQGFHMFDPNSRSAEEKIADTVDSESSSFQFDHMKVIGGIIKRKKVEVDCFLSNMGFARVGGAPSTLVDMASTVKNDAKGAHTDGGSNSEGHEASSAQKLASGLLNIPLSNVERLKSTLSTLSFSELIECFPHLGRSSKDHPDKKKLFSVQDFFVYTEAEGKRFFEELDRDGDGQVTLDDLELAMRKRKLPRRYARDVFHRTRSHLFSKSFGWKQFLSLIKQKDPTILRAYTTLCLSKSGMLQKNHILTSLESAGLPANEDNAAAMLRCLVSDAEGSISYSHFRNFMILLPSEHLEEDPRSIWFEAATVVAVPPPVEIPASSVLKAALAGGMACALSTSLMHPIDTMKTRVQASTLSFPELIGKLPEIGLQGLYRGSFPAIIGQFSSHGLRTGIFEASKLVLVNVAPTLPDIQVQSISSFCSTILGTAVRIPCEVLKQRLQAGIFDNVGDALVGTIRQDGLKGFFRGTGATLCREVPFYVAGMGLYAEAKKAAQHLLDRELEPWEVIIVGALSGGLAAVVTTPFDVMKTRMMTARQGRRISMSIVALSIVRREGPLGLFKGAVPRFFWIAPLGAMNFAGYELAKKAMDRPDPLTGDQQ